MQAVETPTALSKTLNLLWTVIVNGVDGLETR